MGEKYTQIQELAQQQKLSQTVSHQQLLQASLVELPLMQLVDRVNTEMNDNPALEPESSYDYLENSDYPDSSDNTDTSDAPEDFEALSEREDRCLSITVAMLWQRNVRKWCTGRQPLSTTS